MTGPVVADHVTADRAAAVRLGAVLGQLLRMLRRSHVSTLGSGSMSALATVVRQGPVRLGELAEREGVTPATLSRIVTVLEREGYVERRTDPADRRAAFLTATAAGAGAVDELLSSRADVLVARMAALTPQDLAALAAGLDVIERLTG
jgi:DNA-binding MarR family transcriptional regulator